MRKFWTGQAEVRGIVDAPVDEVRELQTDWPGRDRSGRRGALGTRILVAEVSDGL